MIFSCDTPTVYEHGGNTVQMSHQFTVLTDTHGLEVVLGVGDRWTVTSAIVAAAAHTQTAVTSAREARGHTCYDFRQKICRVPEVISWLLAAPKS